MPSTAQAAGGFYAEAIASFLIYFDSGRLSRRFGADPGSSTSNDRVHDASSAAAIKTDSF